MNRPDKKTVANRTKNARTSVMNGNPAPNTNKSIESNIFAVKKIEIKIITVKTKRSKHCMKFPIGLVRTSP